MASPYPKGIIPEYVETTLPNDGKLIVPRTHEPNETDWNFLGVYIDSIGVLRFFLSKFSTKYTQYLVKGIRLKTLCKDADNKSLLQKGITVNEDCDEEMKSSIGKACAEYNIAVSFARIET